jgi:hypothetical protein
MLGVDGHVEGSTFEIESPLALLAAKAQSLLSDFDAALDAEASRVAPQLQVRHPELVAPSVLLAEARRFHVDVHGIHQVLTLLAES